MTKAGAAFVDYTAGDVVDRLRAQTPDGSAAVVRTVGGDSLRSVAPLAAEPDALVSIGDLRSPNSVARSSSAASTGGASSASPS